MNQHTKPDRFITPFIEQFIAPIILLAVGLLFFQSIKNAFDGFIVEKILTTLQPALLTDLGVLTIIGSVIVWCVYLYKNDHYLSSRFCLMIVGLTALYVIARITKAYHFYPFSFMPVKYADMVLVIFVSVSVLKIKNWKDRQRPDTAVGDPFLVDVPISQKDEDKFNRARFAADIAKRILSQTAGSAPLAIGINGAWGSGKTSFMNLIRRELIGHKKIIIDFNPWTSASAVSIIPHFFAMLSHRVAPFDSRLRTLINTYGASISEIPDNSMVTSGWKAMTKWLSGESKEVDHEKVNEAIKNIKKQIVVFIDDLDRLDHQEIIEVLKLIRNTANFNNIVYVAAYDREYVNEAIKKYNTYNFQQFVDKIFDVEFSLPIYESSFIPEYIKTELFKKMELKFHEELSAIIDRKEYRGSSFTQMLFTTRRDAVRFCNSFLFDIGSIAEEVSVRDFYLVQLLKLKFKVVFDALAVGKYRFFVYSTDKRSIEMIEFRGYGDAAKTAETINIERVFDKDTKSKKDEPLEFDVFLDDLASRKLIKAADKHIIWLVTKMLVPEQEKTMPFFNTQKTSLKSFCYPRNYHKYFSYHLFEGDISEFELEEYRTRPFGEFLDKVNYWLSKGKKEALRQRLRSITEFSNVREFENFIQIVFHLGRNDFSSRDWMSQEYNYLMNALAYPLKESVHLYDNLQDYEQFVLDLFAGAQPPAIFDSSLIDTLIRINLPIGLSWNTLSEINRKYLYTYADAVDKITRPFWTLFGNCKLRPELDAEDWLDDPIAKAYAIKRYQDLTRAEDLGVFIRQTQPYSKYFMFNEDLWRFVVDAVDKLPAWTETSSAIDQTSSSYAEFLQFFKLSESAGFQPVQFSFSHLHPGVWQ